MAATGAASNLPAPHALEEETLPGNPGQRSRPSCSHPWRGAPRHAYVAMSGDPCLSPPRLWGCRCRKATTFLPCCFIPQLSCRHGMQPRRRGFPKSMAATHTLVAQCAPRLPRPEPDRIESHAQGEKGRSEEQPWEEGQRLSRQPLEHSDSWFSSQACTIHMCTCSIADDVPYTTQECDFVHVRPSVWWKACSYEWRWRGA